MHIIRIHAFKYIRIGSSHYIPVRVATQTPPAFIYVSIFMSAYSRHICHACWFPTPPCMPWRHQAPSRRPERLHCCTCSSARGPRQVPQAPRGCRSAQHTMIGRHVHCGVAFLAAPDVDLVAVVRLDLFCFLRVYVRLSKFKSIISIV